MEDTLLHAAGGTQGSFIGYQDVYGYLKSAVEPFMEGDQRSQWGISRPVGIVLYGPPGSGKIFWARKIAEMVGYSFSEVKKHYFGTSYFNGNRQMFDEYLLDVMKQKNVLLFMEDFDEIMSESTPERLNAAENEQTKEIVLHYVGKFEEENLLMVGSAGKISGIDPEILAPGRFDVMIPIFPPNVQERAQMIVYHLSHGLAADALLLKILKDNRADEIDFWSATAQKMRVFSNTMIVDFTQILKKKIKNMYKADPSESIIISQKMLDNAFRESAVKLTSDYFDQVARFLHDVRDFNYDDFSQRSDALGAELDTFKVPEKPGRSIGFQHNSAGAGGV